MSKRKTSNIHKKDKDGIEIEITDNKFAVWGCIGCAIYLGIIGIIIAGAILKYSRKLLTM